MAKLTRQEMLLIAQEDNDVNTYLDSNDRKGILLGRAEEFEVRGNLAKAAKHTGEAKEFYKLAKELTDAVATIEIHQMQGENQPPASAPSPDSGLPRPLEPA